MKLQFSKCNRDRLQKDTLLFLIHCMWRQQPAKSKRERQVSLFLEYNHHFFRAVKEAKSFSSPNKRRKATDSTFAHQDEVTRFFTAGMVTSSMCPSTFDNFYIRRDVKILRQEYILPHPKEMEINAHAAKPSVFRKFSW
jgi:hypothetical protein